MNKEADNEKSKDQCNINSVAPRFLSMQINIKQHPNGNIDVRDNAGIRLLSLEENKDRGLWLYFNCRINQNEG